MSVAHQTGHSLSTVVSGCKLGIPSWQKALYEQYYGFAFSICLRYASSKEDAIEMINDGFMRVFKGMNSFVEPEDQSLLSKIFMGWFKKIIINTCINYSKSSLKKESDYASNQDADQLQRETVGSALDNLEYMDLVQLIQKLSPAYRNTFSLYAIEGYTHEQISETLGISVGASKSNLLKARKKLKTMLEKLK